MSPNQPVNRGLLRVYITAMFALVLLCFAVTMTVVLNNSHKDAERAKAIAIILATNNAKANEKIAQASYENCQKIEELKTSARASAKRGLHSLGTIQYYKDHPEDLQKAKDSLNEQLVQFKADPCTIPSSVKAATPK